MEGTARTLEHNGAQLRPGQTLVIGVCLFHAGKSSKESLFLDGKEKGNMIVSMSVRLDGPAHVPL